jgi:hypothetical protein
VSALVLAGSSLTTSLKRYGRSWGLWVLLLIAPVAARFMVSRDDGSGVVIALNGQLPVMTSAMLGVSLGVVITTLLLPVGFLYLRSSTTRRQPWQVEETTAGSRVAVALGRWGADVAVFAALLVVLTLAGWLLGWLIVPPRPFDPGEIALGLWLIAGPSLMGLAALRVLLDALPFTRRGLGEVVCLILWIISLTAPVIALANRDGTLAKVSGFEANLRDFAGFATPLVYAAPPGKTDLEIGATEVKPGHVPLDVMAGLKSPGYIESRLAWAGIAALLAAVAGLAYAPHRPIQRKPRLAFLTRWLQPGAPPAADPKAPAARFGAAPLAGLFVAEVRLIGAGRGFLVLAAVIALAGLAGDFRHVGSPAALLLLIFALTAQAGRCEARGLLALTRTTATSPWLRRAVFVAAGAAWSMLLAMPAMVVAKGGPLGPLTLALATGGGTALTAMALAVVSRSAFAPRMVLLAAWYVYFST